MNVLEAWEAALWSGAAVIFGTIYIAACRRAERFGNPNNIPFLQASTDNLVHIASHKRHSSRHRGGTTFVPIYTRARNLGR